MRQLSASNPFAKWMGHVAIVLVAVALVIGAVSGFEYVEAPKLVGMMLFALVAGIGYFWERQLADEVHDLGDAILVTRGGQQQRFELKDVDRIDRSAGWTSRYFTLHLRRRDPFGDSINFRPGPGIGEPERNEFNRRVAATRIARK